MKLLLRRCLLSVVLSLVTITSFADAPVVDASTSYQNKVEAAVVNAAPTLDQSVDAIGHAQNASENVMVHAVSASKPIPSATILSQSATSAAKVPLPANLASMPTPLRVRRLEQQVNNIANMNLPSQITQLQQQIAQLRGQLEVQGHDLQLINKQLRNFYKDLDNRISQLSNLNAANNNTAGVSNTKIDNNVMKAPTSVQLQDANAYQLAFSMLTNHQFDKAKQSFSAYLNQYPNGKYVADAHYWLGEIYLTKKDYKNANTEFQTVISKYSSSSKVSDAKLKIAIIHANTGKIDQAKTELNSIKKSHPDSTAAQLANIRLQQIDQGPDLTGN